MMIKDVAKKLAKAWATKKNNRVAEINDQRDQQQRIEERCIYRDKQYIEGELSEDRVDLNLQKL